MLIAIPPVRGNPWRHHTTKRKTIHWQIAVITGGPMAETPEPLEKLVKVFDTDVESEAMVVQGLLESAGVEAVISNREAPQDVLPGVGGVVILVREEQAREAAAIIQEYSTHPTTDEDEEVTEEPAGPKP